MSYLVEAKNEFTIQLVNALTPLIYDGLNSIYKEARKISKSNEILKMFQSFLKKIPTWNENMINDEKNRILNNVEYPEDILDLVKATVKSNISILTFDAKSRSKKIDKNFYKNVDLGDFVHRIYIECAREIWNNPYLFYHVYEPIDLKRNQRDSFSLIKASIKEAIRKMLPRRFILETYLNEDLDDKTETNFEKSVTKNEGKVIDKLVKQQLNNGFYDDRNSFNIYGDNKKSENLKKRLTGLQNGGGESSTSRIRSTSSSDSSVSVRKSEKTEKSVGSKILSIIDKSKQLNNRIDLDSSALPFDNQDINLNNEKKLTPIVNQNSDVLDNTLNSNVSNMDSRIKDILNNDLGDSDLDETSVYNLEKDPTNYQEVFSNSVKEDQVNNIVNSTDRRKNLEKNQFFANYLRV